MPPPPPYHPVLPEPHTVYCRLPLHRTLPYTPAPYNLSQVHVSRKHRRIHLPAPSASHTRDTSRFTQLQSTIPSASTRSQPQHLPFQLPLSRPLTNFQFPQTYVLSVLREFRNFTPLTTSTPLRIFTEPTFTYCPRLNFAYSYPPYSLNTHPTLLFASPQPRSPYVQRRATVKLLNPLPQVNCKTYFTRAKQYSTPRCSSSLILELLSYLVKYFIINTFKLYQLVCTPFDNKSSQGAAAPHYTQSLLCAIAFPDQTSGLCASLLLAARRCTHNSTLSKAHLLTVGQLGERRPHRFRYSHSSTISRVSFSKSGSASRTSSSFTIRVGSFTSLVRLYSLETTLFCNITLIAKAFNNGTYIPASTQLQCFNYCLGCGTLPKGRDNGQVELYPDVSLPASIVSGQATSTLLLRSIPLCEGQYTIFP